MVNDVTIHTKQQRRLVMTLGVAVLLAAPIMVIGQTSSPDKSNSPRETTSPKLQPARLSDYQPCPSPAPSPLSTDSAKEDFSQLTVLLFASGVAFFIALLAWSDQIRGIDKDIRELEGKFQESTGIDKRTFLAIVEPSSPDDRLQALFAVTTGDRIKGRNDAEVLQICTSWHREWVSIMRLSTWKYYVAIALTIVLFGVGAISIFIDPSKRLAALFGMKVQMLLLIFPAALVALLLVIIVLIAERERALRSLVKSVSDKV